MKKWFSVIFGALLCCSPLSGEESEGQMPAKRPGEPGEGAVAGAIDTSSEEDPLALPEWTAEDRKKLIRGTLVPGQALLGMDDLFENFGEVPAAENFDIEGDAGELNPTQIPSEILSRYRASTADKLITDPQHLMTMQERMDQEHFLSLQAKESPVRIHLLLFDREQIVPSEINLRGLLDGPFEDQRWTVLVQYHLGNPKRTQLALTPDLARVIDEDKRLSMLREAINGAIRQSNSESQLQSFLIALSSEIYWIENKVRQAIKAERVIEGEVAEDATAGVVGANGKERDAERMTLASAWKTAVELAGWTGATAFACGIFVLLWVIFLKIKSYRFPELAYEPRLGAAHAGGVGPVLKFKNPNLSPTLQRSEAMPDYLTRI